MNELVINPTYGSFKVSSNDELYFFQKDKHLYKITKEHMKKYMIIRDILSKVNGTERDKAKYELYSRI